MPEYLSEEHGGLDPAEIKRLNLSPGNLRDFSVNSNPFGPSPKVLQAIQRVDISCYPERGSVELCEKLAELNGVGRGEVLVGNGTAELIWLAAQAFIKPGERVLIIGPTFGEYHKAATQMGAVVEEIRANQEDFGPPIPAAINFIRRQKPRLVFLCNPNNPSGKLISQEDMQSLIKVCENHCLLILDEAYFSFSNGRFFGSNPITNCLVLRSMTKDFALAGLRLGYALAAPELIRHLKNFQPAWSVNAFAHAAGLAALSDLDYYRCTLEKLKVLSQGFFHDLNHSGWVLVPSDVHFCLVLLKQPAGLLRLKLLKEGFQVRDCASFGLENYIRLSTRLKRDNDLFLKVLRNNLPGY